MKKTFILDTNVLLHDPRAMFSFEDNDVVIPIYVVEEIDNFKKELSELGRNALNDDWRIVRELNHRLLLMRVRPYYIYQCDLSQGISHFRTSIEDGLKIMENLRGHTSGLAVPTYVVDAPGGGGKIPLLPEYVVGRSEKTWHLRNFRGENFTYIEP